VTTEKICARGPYDDLRLALRGEAVSKRLGGELNDVSVNLAIVDPRTVSDAFGRRIAKRFVAFQVTVGNVNKDYDFLIHSLHIRFEVDSSHGTQDLDTPSIDLTILRGVAEKGQSQSPRNFMIRALRGIGTVAAAYVGVIDPTNGVYARGIAAFNGPVVTSLESVFPDHTINQMNRLNDSAYTANTLVQNERARVMVGFVPQVFLIKESERNEYWNDPHEALPYFLPAVAQVTGTFITELADVPPVVSSLNLEGDRTDFQASSSEIAGEVVGRFLQGAALSVSGFDGAAVEIEGDTTDTRINFKLKLSKAVPPQTKLHFKVTRGDLSTTHTKVIDYSVESPPLSALSPNNAALSPGDVEVTLTGSGFVPGLSTVTASDGLGVALAADSATTSEMKITVTIADDTEAKAYEIRVNNAGASSNSETFTIAAEEEGSAGNGDAPSEEDSNEDEANGAGNENDGTNP